MSKHNHKTSQIPRWVIVFTDLLLINAAFFLGYYLRYEAQLFKAVDPVNYVAYQSYLLLQLGYTATLVFTLWLDGAWNLRRGSSWLDEVYRIVNGTTTGMAVMLVMIFGIRPLAFSRLLFLYVSVLTVLSLSASRLLKRSIESHRRRRGIGVDRTLIVGSGEVARAVMRTLVARPELGYQVVGYIDLHPGQTEEAIGRFPLLGGLDDLGQILGARNIHQVIITIPSNHGRKIQKIIRQCRKTGVRARMVPDFFQLSLHQVDVDTLAGIPLLGVRDTPLGRGPRLAKRAMDIVGAAVAMVLAAPVVALTALAIRLESKGPVFFKQERLGENQKPFQVIKFRSMRVGADEEKAALMDQNEADGPLFKMKDDPRQTKVGRILRRISLDELPQVINILRGEMSIVGPRPPLASEFAEYEPWQRKRLAVKPGLTGLWQVSGRSDLPFDEMCLLDIYYIENWSLWLDIRIILKTIPQLLLARGAY